MISINNLAYHLGSRTLYEGLNLHIKPRDRIGLIGVNGSGKSTLLRLIAGEYTADEGTISIAKDCSIGYLNQDLLSLNSDKSILSVAMEAFERENSIQEQIDRILLKMETEYTDKLVNQLTKLQDEFSAIGGYAIQSRAEEILEGLGFVTAQLSEPMSTFSGGWRMRVILAKMLLKAPSLLMLDEPTNHLDLPTIQWFERYIQNFEGAVIIVSHDREFLNNSVTSIAEVANQEISIYKGNFDNYIIEKELRAEIQNNAFRNQQQQIKQTEKFIERFRSKATKSRQVQSRVKAIERMDMIEEVRDTNAAINFSFNFRKQSGKIVSELKNVSKSFGANEVLKNTNAVIKRGDKIALVGANGIGKSTLLRIIGNEEKVEGEVDLGYNVENTFFAQHQLEALTLSNNLLEELAQTGVEKTELELRGILGCFLFSKTDVEKQIKVLSGGEKSRVALAKMLISEANFLLLDEPTNHLDMFSIEMLTQALLQYQGTYIVISHNRDFISNIANKIWYIENKQLKEYPGTFEEYQQWLDKKQSSIEEKPVVKEKKVIPKQKNEESIELKKLKKELEQTEKELEEKKQQKSVLESKLASSEVYGNPDKLLEITTQFNVVKSDIEALEEKWEALFLRLEE